MTFIDKIDWSAAYQSKKFVCQAGAFVPDTKKPRACLESLREASNSTRGLQYAHSCAFVNPTICISSVLDRPAFMPIERSKSVRIRAKPSLGHPRGDGSRRTERGNFTGQPGFRPLECWHELRDNPCGLVSSEASASPSQVEWFATEWQGAQRGTAISKSHVGYTLSASPITASSFRGGENSGRRNYVCNTGKAGAE